MDNTKLSPAANAWLKARGLDSDLCADLGLSSGKDRDGREWLTIPFEENGERVNRKFRRLDEKQWRQDTGGAQIFWRFDCIADEGLADQPLIITEGEFDAITAIQAGFWRVVSVPSGAPGEASENAKESAKYAFVEHAAKALFPVKQVIVAADSDGPGAALLADLTSLLNPARCKFISYPRGCKDLNDILKQQGVEGVRKAINGARWMNVPGVYKLSELPPLPPLKVYRPNIFGPIDKLIPICLGHVSVWTGLAGDGKSTLVNAVMWSIAERENWRIAHAAFESTPQREYMEDLIAFRSGRGAPSFAEIEDGRAWAEEHIVFLVSEGFSGEGESTEWIDASLDWFMQAAMAAIVRYGCKVVILDPWSQIDHEWSGSEREDQYIRRALKRFKSLARVFNVHVAIVAHPAKPKKDHDGRYEVPDGYSISGAAHWKNAPELGVTAYRDPPWIDDPDPNNKGQQIEDENSTRTLIRVWKVKFHRQMNKPGEAYASVDPRTGRYSSPEHWEDRTYGKRYADAPQKELVDE